MTGPGFPAWKASGDEPSRRRSQAVEAPKLVETAGHPHGFPGALVTPQSRPTLCPQAPGPGRMPRPAVPGPMARLP